MKTSATQRAIASALFLGAGCTASVPLNAVAAEADASTDVTAATPVAEMVIAAQRLELLGTASTASEGVVDDQEL